ELAPGVDRAVLLGRIAAVEARSEHPVARALVAAAEAEGLQWPEAQGFQSHTGLGVSAQVDGARVAVGAARMFPDLDLTPFDAAAERLTRDGKTPMLAVVDGRPAGILAVADPIKATTPAAIEALHAEGIRTAM